VSDDRRKDTASRNRLEQIDDGYRAIARRVAIGGAIVAIACVFGLWRSSVAIDRANDRAREIAAVVRTIADQRRQNTLDACNREATKNRETVEFVTSLDPRLRARAVRAFPLTIDCDERVRKVTVPRSTG
jgi:hypothetical protein